jgi:predicted dinucleotide-binding enzyme
MKIAVVGKGNVGGGLADLWEQAGHDVQRIGSQGGDVTGADVMLIAIPGRSVPSVFDTVTGLDGKTVIDATNPVGAGSPDGFASNAGYIKSRTGGPNAKSFNLNFAAIYAGGLENAAISESTLQFLFAIAQGGLGEYF